MIKASDARAKLAASYINDNAEAYAELNNLIELALAEKKAGIKVADLPKGASFVLRRLGYEVRGPITIASDPPFYRIDW